MTTGLGKPLVGVWNTTQPFCGTYIGEKPGYQHNDSVGPKNAKPTSFVGGVYHPHLHKGIDLGCPTGTKVIAPEKGKLVLAAIDNISGDHYAFIQIRPGTVLEFSHLSKFLVPVGTILARGQVFALSGATGHATGPHLHWELRHTSSTITDFHYSYKWMRYNGKRFQVGGDLAGTSWIKPL